MVWSKIGSKFSSLVELGPYRAFYDNMLQGMLGVSVQVSGYCDSPS